jgi:hypothetical protein
MAVGRAAVLMRAALRRRDHVAGVFDGAGAIEDVPVGFTGLLRECGGDRKE